MPRSAQARTRDGFLAIVVRTTAGGDRGNARKRFFAIHVARAADFRAGDARQRLFDIVIDAARRRRAPVGRRDGPSLLAHLARPSQAGKAKRDPGQNDRHAITHRSKSFPIGDRGQSFGDRCPLKIVQENRIVLTPQTEGTPPGTA